jgi:hypothetical protein
MSACDISVFILFPFSQNWLPLYTKLVTDTKKINMKHLYEEVETTPKISFQLKQCFNAIPTVILFRELPKLPLLIE